MPQTRKLVRDLMRTALTDSQDGFNAAFQGIAAAYGVQPIVIDWSASSENFIQSYVEGEERERSRLVRGVRVALYTSLSQQQSGDGQPKGRMFWGEIQAHLDFTLEFSEGVELTENLTENYADAVEDAVLSVLGTQSPLAYLFEAGPVHYGGDFACAREPIMQTDDGYSQRLPFTFIYEVHV